MTGPPRRVRPTAGRCAWPGDAGAAGRSADLGGRPPNAPRGADLGGRPPNAPRGADLGGRPPNAPRGADLGGRPPNAPRGADLGGRPPNAPRGADLGDDPPTPPLATAISGARSVDAGTAQDLGQQRGIDVAAGQDRDARV